MFNASLKIITQYKTLYPNKLLRIKKIVEDYYETWDNYSLSIMYLKIYKLTLKKIPSKLHLFHREFIKDILIRNIHPNIKKRHTLELTKKHFAKLTQTLKPSDFLELSEYC